MIKILCLLAGAFLTFLTIWTVKTDRHKAAAIIPAIFAFFTFAIGFYLPNSNQEKEEPFG